MKFVQFWVFLCLLSVEVLHVSESITVKFLNREPLYVEPGRTLVLEAEFQLQPNEQIMFSTWERENSDGEVRLARNNKANNDRTFVEKDGALLRIKGVIKSDYGLYKVIVTATDGIQVTDYRSVIEITNPSTPSLAMKCSVPTQGAQWDSPRFSWQVDGVSVTNETAELDGSLLRLINLGRNYTCVTDSSQGTGKVEVLMKVLPSCVCVSVRFPSQQPVYVVSGQNLVLQAEIQLPSGDHVTKVTWEHEAEEKRNSGKITTMLAEYPARSSGERTTVDKGGSVMTLRNYQRTDNGVYTVTVRDQKGGQSSARCTVHEYEAVHHVSIMVNVSHSSLHCMEAWGTDPVFRWLHEKVAVTDAVGHVSADGTSLYLNAALCGHFTCMLEAWPSCSGGTQ
ncbi:hypothetical protein Baya_1715 [Bagarius yarrelli]|uniref:Ig-like domain-containing protein n=1 Tax=Bagarius yarrelli TaxID=175774 RepID=A0A556TLW2_BAGYA|nr:hypothetical protein Baya_1715 [Bagarius yarrelli]